MEEGKIKWIGKYEDLEKEKFFKDFSYKIKNIKNENKIKNEELNLNENDNKKNNQIKKIIQDEKKFSGNIDKSVYFSYFKYIGGKFLIFSLIIILFIWQSLKISSDIWLGFWSENQGKYYSNQKYFYIFAILALSSSIFNYLRTVLITSGSLKCSKKLHDEMISSFIKAPISLYHETIPKGRIINRLSKDLTTVDTFTMYWFLTLTSYGSSFLGAVFICVILYSARSFSLHDQCDQRSLWPCDQRGYAGRFRVARLRTSSDHDAFDLLSCFLKNGTFAEKTDSCHMLHRTFFGNAVIVSFRNGI
jgi:ABC-type multidrug transport system fused ATPase/permease subunit